LAQTGSRCYARAMRAAQLSLAILIAISAVAQTQTTPPLTPPQTSIAPNPPLNPALPTIFIVGDSTARNQADLGWGDHFARFFDTSRVNIANRAHAGRSSRTFINEGSWDRVVAELKPGDFVLLQMGHNDGGELGGPKPRGTLKGIGPETQDVPQTAGPLSGQTETVHTFGWYLRRYIADTRAKGATPILLTLTVRNIWTPDSTGKPRIERDMKGSNPGDKGYDDYIRDLGAAEHVPVIDMATVEADRLEALGQGKSAALFPIDHTHTSPEGAELNAEAVAQALRNAHSPVAAFLKPN